jgi:hypothetical protein
VERVIDAEVSSFCMKYESCPDQKMRAINSLTDRQRQFRISSKIFYVIPLPSDAQACCSSLKIVHLIIKPYSRMVLWTGFFGPGKRGVFLYCGKSAFLSVPATATAPYFLFSGRKSLKSPTAANPCESSSIHTRGDGNEALRAHGAPAADAASEHREELLLPAKRGAYRLYAKCYACPRENVRTIPRGALAPFQSGGSGVHKI